YEGARRALANLLLRGLLYGILPARIQLDTRIHRVVDFVGVSVHFSTRERSHPGYLLGQRRRDLPNGLAQRGERFLLGGLDGARVGPFLSCALTLGDRSVELAVA